MISRYHLDGPSKEYVGFPLSRQAPQPERTAQPPAANEAPDPPGPRGLQPSGSFLGYLNAYPDHFQERRWLGSHPSGHERHGTPPLGARHRDPLHAPR